MQLKVEEFSDDFACLLSNYLSDFFPETLPKEKSKSLKKNEKLIHKQNIFHIQTKNKKALNVLALQLLGVDLDILK